MQHKQANSKQTHKPLVQARPAIDLGLLKKYDISGPRYTSYPTAAQFTEIFGREAMLEKLAHKPESIEPLSLYFHIPFCHSPCFYCGCNKIITKNRNKVRSYLDALHKEMALMRLQLNLYKRPVSQLHWGGGTPTFLDDAEITELMHHIASYFNLNHDQHRDYSIELDPRTLSEQRIDLLRGLGFNRVSLGIQDFDPQVQAAINRVQHYDDVARQVEYIRARAFHSMNFDLIYGLPHQNTETIKKTLEQVIALSPDRISYYNYAHIPDRFPAQSAIDNDTLPSADEKLKIFQLISLTLQNSGYIHLGMDHFVKPDDSLAQAMKNGTLCRNFQGYSINKANDIVALGVSAISKIDDFFVQNYRDIDTYKQALENNHLPVERGVCQNRDDIVVADIIQQLICYRKLDIGELEQKHNINFQQEFSASIQAMQDFIADGLISMSNHCIYVEEKGLLFLRNICMCFDRYLSPDNSGQIKYSRVI